MTSFEKMILAVAFVQKLEKLVAASGSHERDSTHVNAALEYACGVIRSLKLGATAFYQGSGIGSENARILDEAFEGHSVRAEAKRISDLPMTVNILGLRIRSLDGTKTGTITDVRMERDPYFIVQWDDGSESGFFGNQCDCEIIVKK